MPSPTESSILSNFLLPPAPLPTVLSLAQFTDLFPRQHRSDPQIPSLYRALQHQRNGDIDKVKRNIASEAQGGNRQRRQMVLAQRDMREQLIDAGLDMHAIQVEAELSNTSPTAFLPNRHRHTPETLHPELIQACTDMEADVKDMERQAHALEAEIQALVGDLSDLRYGRFAKTGARNGSGGKGGGGAAGQQELRREVLEALGGLERVCVEANEKGKGTGRGG